jgi:hypothetical protein
MAAWRSATDRKTPRFNRRLASLAKKPSTALRRWVPVALHVAPDDGAVEYVERGKQRRGSVPLVVMRHGSTAPLLHGQPGLGTVEGLDLALLVERQDDGVRGRLDIKADDISELSSELGIGGELELPYPVRLQSMRAPDALHRGDADGARLGHHGGGPVGRLGGRIGERERHDARGHIGTQRRNARGPRLVTQKTVEALRHKAFLPAPDADLRLGGPAHDCVGPDALRAQEDDLGTPDMLVRGVAIPNNRLQTAAILGREGDGDSCAHTTDSHAPVPQRIPTGNQMSDFNH